MNSITNIIIKEISAAVHSIAGTYNIEQPEEFIQALLKQMSLAKTVVARATKKESDEDTASEGGKEKKARKRAVSAKQKELVVAVFPEFEDKKEMEKLVNGYKDASQEDIDALMTSKSKENVFVLFARASKGEVIAAPEPVVEEKKKRAPAAKKDKKPKGRLSWNATETKRFTKIVKDSGSEFNDALKEEFTAFVDGKTDEEFGLVGIEGHMRAFIDSKKPHEEVKAGAGTMTPGEHLAKISKEETDEEVEEDEDLVEFEFNDETLLKGAVSGIIYRSTAEAGDIEIGKCGVGQYASIKI